ncbi:MAG TPA: molybdopterin-guanine dinucleotide biosynthesis protein B [Gemmatimonadales bacterium]|nr:molybdopterin-guanine dinucleotide biosynthesis protein B [Gemmatimonadales bacterium]
MATRIVCIVGRKNAGKTTLTVSLCQEFSRMGRRVMTLKHGHHPALVDREGTDTWRHFHEGGAERTLIASPEYRVLFERVADDYDPVGLARRYMGGADIVLAEGFSRSSLPRIEVWRRGVMSPPLFTDHQDPALWLGVVTDEPGLSAPCPVFDLSQADWALLAAQAAWDGAAEVAP